MKQHASSEPYSGEIRDGSERRSTFWDNLFAQAWLGANRVLSSPAAWLGPVVVGFVMGSAAEAANVAAQTAHFTAVINAMQLSGTPPPLPHPQPLPLGLDALVGTDPVRDGIIAGSATLAAEAGVGAGINTLRAAAPIEALQAVTEEL